MSCSLPHMDRVSGEDRILSPSPTWMECLATLQSSSVFLDDDTTWNTTPTHPECGGVLAPSHGRIQGRGPVVGLFCSVTKCMEDRAGSFKEMTSKGCDVDDLSRLCRQLHVFTVDDEVLSPTWCSFASVLSLEPAKLSPHDFSRFAQYEESESFESSYSMGHVSGLQASPSSPAAGRERKFLTPTRGTFDPREQPSLACGSRFERLQSGVSQTMSPEEIAPLRTRMEDNLDLHGDQGAYQSKQKSVAISTGHVTFASRVDVHLFQDDQRIHFQVQEDARWDTLRHFWHQDGQVLQWPQMLQVVHMLSEQAAHVPNTDSQDRDSRLPVQNQGAAFHPLCQFDSFAMWWPEVTVLCADQKDRVPTLVATWFLSQGESAVCLRPRRVKVHRSMSFAEFQQACRLAWQEILNGNSLHFFPCGRGPA